MDKILILREKKDDYFLKYLNIDYIDNIYNNKYNKYTQNTFVYRFIKKLKLKCISYYLGEWKEKNIILNGKRILKTMIK